ncbi:uncharacterized protein LOC132694597 [Panthera onca]
MLDAAEKAVTRQPSAGKGGRVTSTAPDRPEGQPAQPASFSPAASSRGSRGGGRKGFPVQEAAQAAAASSLTLLSPAPPIPHSPRRRVPVPPPAATPTPSARPLGLSARAPSPPLRGPLIHSLAAGPARRRRGGSGPGQGPRRGGPLHTSLPHLGAAEPLAPAAAFSACAALAPSPKWRGPGVLAGQPPPPPPPPPPLCLRRRGRRLGKSSSELTDEFGAGRPQRAERRAIDARGARFLFRPACGEGAAEGGVGRGKRGSLRAPPGRRRGPGRRRSSGGRAGGGRGWRAAVGGGAGPAEQGGLGGASAGRGGGTAGPTRRPASGLSPQSPARNRRLGPGPARSGLPCRTLFGSTRTSFGKSSAPRGRLHSCTFIYCHLLQVNKHAVTKCGRRLR